MQKNKLAEQVLILGIILLVLFWVDSARLFFAPYSESVTIGGNAQDFKQLSERFTALAKEKGGVYAYEVLKRAQLPLNTDLHLLAHAVGDELYRQKGVAGIADCTQDFRNACSHTIVIGALNDFGEDALPKIREACSRAPGGTGAYTMCYHGLGHGVFAYFNYDLPETIALCKKTGTESYREREYVECAGGAIMELMGGGGHDRDLWLAARDKYLNANDPLSPCSTNVIPRDAKGMCYTYITPHLFEAAGADLASPQPIHFAEAFLMCDKISKAEQDLRQACFAGIGKEFPVLAFARDIRAIGNATDKELGLMREWCALAPHEEAYESCTGSVVGSLFWGGENDPNISVRFCSAAVGNEKSECFERIFGEAATYLPISSPGRGNLCARVPDEFKSKCADNLSL